MNDELYKEFQGEVVGNSAPTDEILRGYFPDYNYKGTIIEIGAFDPIIISNSYHFEKNGWNAFCIDANPYNFKRNDIRKNFLNFACSDFDKDDVDFDVVECYHAPSKKSGWTASFSSLKTDFDIVDRFDGRNAIQNIKKIKTKVRKLDTLLKSEMSEVEKIDILTIDVEGSEMDVLRGFDLEKWKPEILFVEDIFYNNGESELSKHILSLGYHLDKVYDYNCFYKKGI